MMSLSPANRRIIRATDFCGNGRINVYLEDKNLIFSLKTLVDHILPRKLNLINLSVSQEKVIRLIFFSLYLTTKVFSANKVLDFSSSNLIILRAMYLTAILPE